MNEISEVLRQRIEDIVEVLDARADASLIAGENHSSDTVGNNLVGFAAGVQFARDIVIDELSELLESRGSQNE